MVVDRYGVLGLTDNPFPQVATVDPTSPNIRTNGSIYNEEIVRDQIEALRQRLERRENLIYAQNTKFTYGVGKSALIAREWRRLQEQSPESTVYMRCGRGMLASSVDGVCNTIVEAWLKNGALWKAFCGVLKKYVSQSRNSDLDRGTVDTLVSMHQKMPTTVSARALMLWDTRGVVENLASWLEGISSRIQHDIAIDYLTCMLSTPRKFGESYPKKAKRREVTAFITVSDLLRIGDVGHLYIFLDQFEELFHGRGKRELAELASGMRQILESCSDHATFVVTLHPSAAMQLRSADSQSLTTIAPVDDRHVVDLPNITPTDAVRLAQTYIDRFRIPGAEKSSGSEPLDEECVKRIAVDRDGNLRDILQTLYACVEEAVENGVSRIDSQFFEDHYRHITGKVSKKDEEL